MLCNAYISHICISDVHICCHHYELHLGVSQITIPDNKQNMRTEGICKRKHESYTHKIFSSSIIDDMRFILYYPIFISKFNRKLSKWIYLHFVVFSWIEQTKKCFIECWARLFWIVHWLNNTQSKIKTIQVTAWFL